MDEGNASARVNNGSKEQVETGKKRPVYICDRCGFQMIERHCKVVCPNCGSRWDCSDLNIYVDEDSREAQ